MSQLLIGDLDQVTLSRLTQQAAQHGRTVEAEVKAIIAAAVLPVDPWASTNAHREELARSGREFPDSTPLIREDRER